MMICPIASMHGIFTYFYYKNQPNVGKYTIHGSYGFSSCQFPMHQTPMPSSSWSSEVVDCVSRWSIGKSSISLREWMLCWQFPWQHLKIHSLNPGVLQWLKLLLLQLVYKSGDWFHLCIKAVKATHTLSFKVYIYIIYIYMVVGL